MMTLWLGMVWEPNIITTNPLCSISNLQQISRHLWWNGYQHKKMELANRVQIPYKAVCISHSTNTLRKGMIPTIHSPAVGKY